MSAGTLLFGACSLLLLVAALGILSASNRAERLLRERVLSARRPDYPGLADRLANEYQLEVVFEPSPYAEARWLSGEKVDVEDFQNKHRSAMAVDIDEQPVFLAKSAWEIGYVSERLPKVVFERAKERA